MDGGGGGISLSNHQRADTRLAIQSINAMRPEKARGAPTLDESLGAIGGDALHVPEAKALIHHRHQQIGVQLPDTEGGQFLADEVGMRAHIPAGRSPCFTSRVGGSFRLCPPLGLGLGNAPGDGLPVGAGQVAGFAASPCCPDTKAIMPKASGAGDAWTKGHYDLVGRIEGELELYGHKFAVSCVDGLDRSWGPRAEWNSTPVSWMHLTFGDDLAFHLVITLDVVNGQQVYTTFRFGYAVVDGECCAVTAAEVDAESLGMLGMHRIVRITDAKGRQWEIVGSAIAAAPWHTAYTSFLSFQTLYRWTMGTREGFSNVTDVIGVTTLSKRLSRLANTPA